MAKSNQHGFTLIELILVMAISSSLLLIAFVGQGQLRAQAQFDATVNKLVSSIGNAHNQATAGVNISPAANAGTGVNGCPSGSNGVDYVFAGVAWVATGPGSIRMDFYKAVPQSGSANDSCVFSSVPVSLPSPIQVNIANAASFQGGRELFVRNNDVLNICPLADNTVNAGTIFRSGTCLEGTLVLTITDGTGRKGQVTVDKSGLAQRNF